MVLTMTGVYAVVLAAGDGGRTRAGPGEWDGGGGACVMRVYEEVYTFFK